MKPSHWWVARKEKQVIGGISAIMKKLVSVLIRLLPGFDVSDLSDDRKQSAGVLHEKDLEEERQGSWCCLSFIYQTFVSTLYFLLLERFEQSRHVGPNSAMVKLLVIILIFIDGICSIK
ncbi:hypothetical protein K2173_010899 [Erythroxylum novogranatense]|uniref:Uncharacterized protein n=1 Tax=Erythroxylum novogranatense TaxID=1862640 RepID=A0AAV8T1F1_9ROSI|nr:hypothetical protein K2173_010899 [Erythroxylum novogranatense]